jgi:hypothetical protein
LLHEPTQGLDIGSSFANPAAAIARSLTNTSSSSKRERAVRPRSSSPAFSTACIPGKRPFPAAGKTSGNLSHFGLFSEKPRRKNPMIRGDSA